MGVTMRVVRGRQGKNSKYTIRRSVKIHAYGTDNGFAVRVTQSSYRGSSSNDPSRSSNNNIAAISVDDGNGERRKYVAIR